MTSPLSVEQGLIRLKSLLCTTQNSSGNFKILLPYRIDQHFLKCEVPSPFVVIAVKPGEGSGIVIRKVSESEAARECLPRGRKRASEVFQDCRSSEPSDGPTPISPTSSPPSRTKSVPTTSPTQDMAATKREMLWPSKLSAVTSLSSFASS